MTKSFGSLVFTPVVKSLQERYNSRRQYARMEQFGGSPGGFGPDETEYLSERDTFFMASIGTTGWPYVQHRGGPKGFLKVIDAQTLAFADFLGNKQYVSTGNLITDDRVALILVDFPRQLRLKILGHVEILDGEKMKDLLARVRDADYKATVERIFVIHVEAFDWNCSQHIVPRFTQGEIRDALQPIEKQMQELQAENAKLRERLAATGK
jgi:predicted pyridoxine 5'-phosphate oxidase superfamily flavin-nucleotide-binding protein